MGSFVQTRNNTFFLLQVLSLLAILLIVGGFVFYQPYKVVRKNTLDSLNAQQLVLAKQAAGSINAFFKHYERLLHHLALHEEIIHLNHEGIHMLEDFYNSSSDEISAVTRIDKNGIITHTIPFNKNAIGKDISKQAHNRFIIATQQQVVSDVFMAVQGYRTVAYAVPIFDGESYAGSLTILIPFKLISERYISNIVLGIEGYAWMIGRDGVELYCPVPGHMGKTIYETSSQFPTVIEMAEEMMTGKQGVTSYIYDRIKNKKTESIRKHAVYYPVKLPNNFWSIVVATPEHEAIAAIKEFGRWWLGIFSVLILLVVTIASLLIRSRYTAHARREQEVADKKIRESERLFREIISNSNIPMFMVHVNDTIEFINKRCENLYGYSLEDIPTVTDWFEKVFPDETMRTVLRESWEQELSTAIATNDVKALSTLELPVVCKNQEVKDVFFEFLLIEERVIVSLTDNTEKNSIEKEKKALLERETRAKKMEVVGLMAGGVAHDLNNILSGIVSYPDILLAQIPDNSPLRKPLLTMQESGQRAATVVEDLLTAARGAANQKEIHNINILIEEQLNSPEQDSLQESHPDVTFIVQCFAKRPEIACSPVHIKKSIMNLVTNGAEAIKGQGTVTITSRNQFITAEMNLELKLKTTEYVVVTVKDSGLGIPKDDLEHVFEPFYSKKKMGRSGSGLGLAIVWNSVTDHDGKIFVKSGEGGTTFDIYLPLSGKQDKSLLESNHSEVNRGHGERILVVDDEPMLREIARLMLSTQGYLVNVVPSGEKAIEFLKNKDVDLVLLDMVMEPGINGRQTYEKILTFKPDQRAIIVSGYSESKDVKTTVELGSGGFLKKPYSAQKLRQAVAAELQR